MMALLIAFAAGIAVGAVVLALIVAPHLEWGESRFRAGRKSGIDDARQGLIPGLVPTQDAIILIFPPYRRARK